MNTREGKNPPKSRPLKGFVICRNGMYLVSVAKWVPCWSIYKYDAMRLDQLEKANRVYREIRRMGGAWSVRLMNALDGSERIVWQ